MCNDLKNPNYSVQVTKTDGKKPFCIRENFAPELKSKEECEEWAALFNAMREERILVLTTGSDSRVDIYAFESQKMIDGVLGLIQ